MVAGRAGALCASRLRACRLCTESRVNPPPGLSAASWRGATGPLPSRSAELPGRPYVIPSAF